MVAVGRIRREFPMVTAAKLTIRLGVGNIVWSGDDVASGWDNRWTEGKLAWLVGPLC